MRSWNVLLYVIGSLVLTVSLAPAQPNNPPVVRPPLQREPRIITLENCALFPLLSSTAAPTVASVQSDLDVGPIGQDRSHLARVGTRVVITGTGLCGAAIALKDAYEIGQGVWVINSASNRNFAITPTKQTPITIEFAVPDVPVNLVGTAVRAVMYIIVLTKNSQTTVAADALAVFPTPPPRNISGVDPPAVALPSTMSPNHQPRLAIHGTGFLDPPNVVGGVFGNGTVDSLTNPIFSIANLSTNYVELWLPPTCDQEGPVMLLTQPVGGGAGGSPYDSIIPASGAITAACMRDAPNSSSYSLAGETPIVNNGVTYGGMLKIPPGNQTITVRGPYLRFIKEVWENSGGDLSTKLNFHYTRTSNQPSTVETMTVDVPNAQPNSEFGLCLMFIDGLPGISNTCYGQSSVQVTPN
jgi:hypothetical protein